ncbi:MAG: hypothetical protein QW680_01470 [Pyrobaculum sp.]
MVFTDGSPAKALEEAGRVLWSGGGGHDKGLCGGVWKIDRS